VVESTREKKKKSCYGVNRQHNIDTASSLSTGFFFFFFLFRVSFSLSSCHIYLTMVMADYGLRLDCT